MKYLVSVLRKTTTLICFFLLSTAAFGQTCSFRTLPVPTPGVSTASGINDVGAIVGSFFQDVRAIGFLLFRGKFTLFRFPGSLETTPHDINNRSQIVGDFIDRTGAQHGFVVHSGGFKQIDVPGQPRTLALGINDLGDIVGLSNGLQGDNGFLLHKGKFITVSVPGARETEAWSINNHGEIVGSFQDNTGAEHGFRLKNGVFTIVNFPGAFSTEIRRINEEGEVIGRYETEQAQFHGFSLDKGQFKTIDDPVITPETIILGLNNRDQIVGGGDSPNQAFFADCHKVF